MPSSCRPTHSHPNNHCRSSHLLSHFGELKFLASITKLITQLNVDLSDPDQDWKPWSTSRRSWPRKRKRNPKCLNLTLITCPFSGPEVPARGPCFGVGASYEEVATLFRRRGGRALAKRRDRKRRLKNEIDERRYRSPFKCFCQTRPQGSAIRLRTAGCLFHAERTAQRGPDNRAVVPGDD